VKKVILGAAALGLGLVIAAIAPVAWSGGGKIPSADEQLIQARSKKLIDAFNKGDAKTIASFWTEDGDYMDEGGRRIQGRAAIEAYFHKMFDAGKGAELRVYKTNFRLVRPDLAIGDGVMEVIPPGGGPSTSARYTAVQVKQDGQWYFESVREAVVTPPTQAEKLEDISWLIGAWVAEDGKKGPSMTMDFSWAENNNFIVNRFTNTVQDVPVAGGTQWIAWDPAAKMIRAWVFDSTGSISEASWVRDGKRLTSKTTTTLPDGKKATSNNIVTRIDDNSITMQMTNRSVDGKSQADSPEFKLKRVR
jgi:uncharacterized protein (TIGR02246 family)